MNSYLASQTIVTSGSNSSRITLNQTWINWSNQVNLYSGTSTIQVSPTLSYPTNHLETWQYWSSNVTGNSIFIQNTASPGAGAPVLQRSFGGRIIAPLRRVLRRSSKPVKNRAEIKAETLLLKHLTRQQRLTWLNGKYFDIDVGERRYRIRKGWAGNVDWIGKDGKKIATYCCHPNIGVPLADCAMSQMMMLLYDEAGFLKLANAQYFGNRIAA